MDFSVHVSNFILQSTNRIILYEITFEAVDLCFKGDFYI